MNKKYIAIALGTLLLAGTWGVVEYRSRHDNKPPIETFKQVKYSFSVQNKTNELISEGKLWISAPVQENSFQTCLEIEANYPYQLLKNKDGNQVLYFTINNLAPFATMMINVQAKLRYISLPQTIEILDEQTYLKPEKHIESNDPQIIALANQLKRKTSLETAKSIYDWVSSNIEYSGYIKNSRGALYALKNKKGDCTEYMFLFVALCRANNIPARGIGGYPCSGNCIFAPSTYHNWAEFYDDGAWQIADCQKKVFAQDTDQYVAMKIITQDEKDPLKGYNRFRFEGNGLKVKMNR